MRVPREDVASLWHELGMLYAVAGEDARRAKLWGLAVLCASGALVLLSAPVFGTAWAGPFAALVPVLAGILVGGGSFLRRRTRFVRRRKAIGRLLSEHGEDGARPTASGLGAYYDAQLILLRSEYEHVARKRGRGAARSARLLEAAFGFTPEDPFECGPLNVAPDTSAMSALRARWESRLAMGDARTPALGLREDRAYRVFPREMTVPFELATRKAYLTISRDLLGKRYGDGVPFALRRRADRDRAELAALTKGPGR